MKRTRFVAAFAAIGIIALVGACGGSGNATPTGTATSRPQVTTPTIPAEPTEDAGAVSTQVAGSLVATLGPALLNPADYPPDLAVQRQQPMVVKVGDVPGVTAAATGFFATLATASGDEFVSVVVLPLPDSAAAVVALAALTPEKYLAGLTGSSRDASSTPLDLNAAPPGASGFNYTGTVPGAVPRSINGEAVGFLRGSTFILLTHARYAPSTRGIDVTKIASAISARMNDQGGLR